MNNFDEMQGSCPYCGQEYDEQSDWEAHVDFCEDQQLDFPEPGDVLGIED